MVFSFLSSFIMKVFSRVSSWFILPPVVRLLRPDYLHLSLVNLSLPCVFKFEFVLSFWVFLPTSKCFATVLLDLFEILVLTR